MSTNFDGTDLKTSLALREKGKSSRDEQSAPSTAPRKRMSSLLPMLVAEGLIAANAGIAASSPYGFGGALLMLTPILGVEGCGTACYMVGAGIGGYNLSLDRSVSPLQKFLRNEIAWHTVLGTDVLFHRVFTPVSPSYAEGGISLDFYGDDILGEAALSVDSNWGNHVLRGRLSYLYDDDLVNAGCSVGPEYEYRLFGRTPRRLKPKIGASIARVFGCAKSEEKNLAERFGGQGLVSGGAEISLRRGNSGRSAVSLNVLWYARKLFANEASPIRSVAYGAALGVTLR